MVFGDLCAVTAPVIAKAPPREAATIAETRLRSKPSLRSEPILRLPAGAMLMLHGKPEGGWYRVRRGPLEGYVRSGDVATAPEIGEADAGASPGETIDAPRVVEQQQRVRGRKGSSKGDRKGDRKQGRKEERKRERKKHHGSTQHRVREVMASTDLNLRASPDASAPVNAVMPRGERIEPTGQHQDGWVELRWRDETGWALGRHLAAPKPVTIKSDGDASTWSRDELKAIIYDAADRYGQPREDMLRVARCESNLDPAAINRDGGSYGLFQFKPGTWLSTPFGEYDIFDPRASANAAGWMWSEGRRREWVCQ